MVVHTKILILSFSVVSTTNRKLQNKTLDQEEFTLKLDMKQNQYDSHDKTHGVKVIPINENK